MDGRAANDPPAEVPRALGRLRVALEDAYTQTARDLGLTAQQADLLCAALRPAAVGDIAQQLRCDRSNVSRLVDRASARDLVTRREAEEDARVKVIELTAAGERLARDFMAGLESRTAALRAGWSSQQQESATRMLHEISDALDSPRRLPPRRQRKARSG
ncbi:MAG: MarR family winged helix-turn-helix transcriptional regulator [Candidatus Dormibacteria bacterium]